MISSLYLKTLGRQNRGAVSILQVISIQLNRKNKSFSLLYTLQCGKSEVYLCEKECHSNFESNLLSFFQLFQKISRRTPRFVG